MSARTTNAAPKKPSRAGSSKARAKLGLVQQPPAEPLPRGHAADESLGATDAELAYADAMLLKLRTEGAAMTVRLNALIARLG